MGIFHGKASDIVNRKELLNYLMPVGYIYISTSNISPEVLFGGKWEPTGQGRVLIGSGSIESNTTTDQGLVTSGEWTAIAGTRGGELKHQTTQDEMPQHSHKVSINIQHGDGETISGEALTSGLTQGGRRRYFDTTGNSGITQAHNNVQPYLVVYMWERIE